MGDPVDRHPARGIREGAREILPEMALEQVAIRVVDPPPDDGPRPGLEYLVPIAEKLAGLVDHGRIAEGQVADDAPAQAFAYRIEFGGRRRVERAGIHRFSC